MKKSAIFFAATILGFAATAAHADTLKGSKVRAVLFFNGQLTVNYFNDPADQNPTLDKIGSGREFLYDDGVATYTANFNANELIIRVKCDAGRTLAKCDKEPEFLMEFKDDVFANSTFNVVDNSLLVVGGVLQANPKVLLLTNIAPLQDRNETFILDIEPLPEPNSIVLFGTGLLGFAGLARRRLFA